MQISELSSLLLHYTQPHYSFYRGLYGLSPESAPLSVDSKKDWEALPLLTKDALSARTLKERSFLPMENLDHLRASSGTSGKGVLFSPRTHVRGMEYRLSYHDFTNAFMAFSTPMMPHWHELFQKEHGRLPRVVVYDPGNPAASARLARAAGVDGMSVFVFHIAAIGEEMKKNGMAQRILFLEITGEICTRTQYQYMRETFPNATIVQSYNSSEVEDAHIGMPCQPLSESESLAVYHAKKTHHLEIIDPETNKVIDPKAGAEGDLLITAYPGEPASFPLIRYRIGDTVRVVEECCPHGSWSFTVLGRTEMDFLKIPGGMLRADEIARVLNLFSSAVSDRFELHCSEVQTADGPRLKPVLHIEPRTSIDLERLAQDISDKLRISPASTYTEGVAEGRYLPLTCLPLSIHAGAKTRRLILH